MAEDTWPWEGLGYAMSRERRVGHPRPGADARQGASTSGRAVVVTTDKALNLFMLLYNVTLLYSRVPR